MKKAFVFPGQGSQFIGMGKEFYNTNKEARNIMDMACEVSKKDIKKLCFEGPMEELTLTDNVQVAITTVNLMYLAVISENSNNADIVAGHSLGEYSACVAAKVLTAKDAIILTCMRGEYMQECADKNPGAMSAILGMPPEKIENVLSEITVDGIVQVANYNSVKQSVISGNSEAVSFASTALKAAGAMKIIPLKVSGPWHCPLIAGAVPKLSAEFDKVIFSDPKIPFIQNVTGNYVRSASEIAENLKKQITDSVKWVDTMQRMLNDGVETIVEVGPGKVLQGLAKAASRQWSIESI